MGSLTPSFSGSLSSPYSSTTFGKGSNRLSDGRLVIDYITDSLGLPVLPPYQSTTANFTHGVNFAIAGATTLGDKLKTSLFWVGEMGINDYSRAVGSKIPLQSIAKSSVTYTTELVRTLIQNGAKNIVVQGLPPVGCLPLDISLTPLNNRDKSGCSPIVNGAVIIHNQILQAKLEMYRKMFPDVTIIYADSWKAYDTIVNNPQKYQIEETQKTCCGSDIKQDDLNFNLQSLCDAGLWVIQYAVIQANISVGMEFIPHNL
ncbi:hypothetical protein L1987_62043 [Smallanthus sonchifolius]|uniref:Uncharacterized protein n=1 Tax=Smallanthus sonchifolius TaxID=185202 RepID=A0ACB9C993_9ASTR|nr:hypothetical protein L1987_62043 [Smallanthus sonchifolius]